MGVFALRGVIVSPSDVVSCTKCVVFFALSAGVLLALLASYEPLCVFKRRGFCFAFLSKNERKYKQQGVLSKQSRLISSLTLIAAIALSFFFFVESQAK